MKGLKSIKTDVTRREFVRLSAMAGAGIDNATWYWEDPENHM